MKVTTERLMLAKPHTGRITTTCNQCLHFSVAVLCYHNLTEHHYEFIVGRERHSSLTKNRGPM
jgi:hypothetical protein